VSTVLLKSVNKGDTMPKKSTDHKTHKESSSKEHGNQKASQMKGSEKAGQEKGFEKANHEKGFEKAGQQKGFENAGQAKGFENANNKLPEVQGPSLPNGSIGNFGEIPKKGCLPKLSIMVLPFIAILVYVLLSA
jgi:hypothetical protein